MKFDNGCDVIFYVQNVTEHRFSWNKCYIICWAKAADNDIACRNTSEVVKLKVHVLKHSCVYLSWLA